MVGHGSRSQRGGMVRPRRPAAVRAHVSTDGLARRGAPLRRPPFDSAVAAAISARTRRALTQTRRAPRRRTRIEHAIRRAEPVGWASKGGDKIMRDVVDVAVVGA